MHELVAEVKRFLEAHAITGPGIVACSGGPDSVALLRAMHELQVPMTVAHVNYRLRGAESDEDEAFVIKLAEQLNVPVQVEHIELPGESNIEAEGRRTRYLWMARLKCSLGANWIATGHTKNDQAETVLHRVLRGTGLRGLRGILRYSEICRPLLCANRADVIDYLTSIQQGYRKDSSNASPRFTRNRIRHELLPLMRSFNPEIVDILSRLAQQAHEAYDFVWEKVLDLKLDAERSPAGAVFIFDREKLTQANPFVVSELFRQIWEGEDWPADRMTFDHWQRLAALEPGDYPGGIRLTLTERVVQLGPRDA